ncbi:uncharacterized protein [Coffea arabica]|uniref:LOB domain-containing protein n=1 Tax=Coffea arabica TaxID=13443 RepID=A0A6P6TE80_COFAR|nr:LOB domain-containing protein 36-like isoform X2 [Coffea arabica]
MSSSNSPCAACKCLRRKCTQECVFAPYFPPDQPQKFINVHRVFGASNVAKLLNELGTGQREDAVNSLAYEAEYRLRDPVYGCVGLISILQQKLKQVQHDLNNAKKELATYIGPSAMLPLFQHPGFMQQHPNNPSASTVMPYAMQPMIGLPTGVAAPHGGPLIIRDAQQQQQQQQQQQMYEAQQYAAAVAARDQEMYRAYEQQQQQQPPPQELMRFNSGFEGAGPAAATAFNTMSCGAAMSPSLALGSYEAVPYHQISQQQQQQQQLPPEHSHSHHHHHNQFQLQSQLMLQQQLPLQQSHHQPQAAQQQHPQRAKSEEGRSVGPSC